MITSDDVVAAFPRAASFDPATLEHWANVANHAVPNSRVKDPKTAQMSRVLFVMHQIEKPALDLNAPHVRARMGALGRTSVKFAHPWAGTPHGDMLRKAVRY